MPRPQLPTGPPLTGQTRGNPSPSADMEGPPPDDGPQDPGGTRALAPARPGGPGILLGDGWHCRGGAHPREAPSAMSPAPCPERPGQLPRLGKQGRGEGRPTPGTGRTPSGPGCWAGHRSSLPDQGSSLRLPRWQAGSSPLSHQGSLVTYSSVWIQALLGGWRVTAWLHLRFSEEPPERWPQRLHQLMLLPTGQEGPLSPHPPRCALPVGFLMGGFCPA